MTSPITTAQFAPETAVRWRQRARLHRVVQLLAHRARVADREARAAGRRRHPAGRPRRPRSASRSSFAQPRNHGGGASSIDDVARRTGRPRRSPGVGRRDGAPTARRSRRCAAALDALRTRSIGHRADQRLARRTSIDRSRARPSAVERSRSGALTRAPRRSAPGCRAAACTATRMQQAPATQRRATAAPEQREPRPAAPRATAQRDAAGRRARRPRSIRTAAGIASRRSALIPSRGLSALEGLVADARDAHEVFDRGEAAIRLAPVDDALRPSPARPAAGSRARPRRPC